jgi:hypothetical protein
MIVRSPLPVPGESGGIVTEAKVRETINPVTGLIQQVRKCLAKREQAYIFIRRQRGWWRSTGFHGRKCGKIE